MSDAAKSDGQVVREMLVDFDTAAFEPNEFNAAWDEHCQSIAAAVVSNAAPRIRAETVEECARVCWNSVDSNNGASVMDCFYAIRALAAATPGFKCVPVSSPLKAKPLQWNDSSGEWLSDDDWGFHIQLNVENGLVYEASWGEGPQDDFTSFDEAVKWCQQFADEYVAKVAMLAEPGK